MNLFGYLPLRLVSQSIFEDSDGVYGSTVLKVFLYLLYTSGIMDIFDKNTPWIPLVDGARGRLTIFGFFLLFLIGFLHAWSAIEDTYIFFSLRIFAFGCIHYGLLFKLLIFEVYDISWIFRLLPFYLVVLRHFEKVI